MLAQRRDYCVGHSVNPLGNRDQPVAAVPNSVETGDVGQQCLGGANVRCGLIAPDVLLASLQGQTLRGSTHGVCANANEVAWQRAHVFLERGDEPRVRAAVSHRYAEALRRTNCNVAPEFSHWCQQHARQQVGGTHDQGTSGMRAHADTSDISVADNCAARRRSRDQHSEAVGRRQLICIEQRYLDVNRASSRAQHRDRLRVSVAVHRKNLARTLCHAVRHRHRLRGGRGLVEKRRVGNLEAG